MNIQLLKEITETPGAPGHEQPIREIVKRELKPFADAITVDNMGNMTVLIKGKKSKKVMVAAHMDEIAFITTLVDDNGFIRFHPLGGFDPKTLTSQRVWIHGKKEIPGVIGCKPIHIMSPEDRNKVVPITEYFIDTGMPKKEVDKYVKVGDTITRDRDLIELGECVSCKSLDNRISVYILIEAMKKVKNLPYDLYGVFTVQEEVGIRGASVASLQIQPDFGFGLDTTIAFDVPGARDYERVTSLGGGAAIKVMDASTICDYRMVDYMKKTADKYKVKWQAEILPAGGTDTAGIQRMTPGGAISGAVSIPTRHIHQTIEMVHKKDVDQAISLLVHSVQDLDKYKWEF
ncbi:MAG: M42 family metallopeptidase [Flavobacteriales bacterium]|nr:M42 family metallopeptidase [Flavobacteriales bacterium]MCB9449603.1 M42 family metallopeptidase [Flavobacteriales bacterium]